MADMKYLMNPRELPTTTAFEDSRIEEDPLEDLPYQPVSGASPTPSSLVEPRRADKIDVSFANEPEVGKPLRDRIPAPAPASKPFVRPRGGTLPEEERSPVPVEEVASTEITEPPVAEEVVNIPEPTPTPTPEPTPVKVRPTRGGGGFSVRSAPRVIVGEDGFPALDMEEEEDGKPMRGSSDDNRNLKIWADDYRPYPTLPDGTIDYDNLTDGQMRKINRHGRPRDPIPDLSNDPRPYYTKVLDSPLDAVMEDEGFLSDVDTFLGSRYNWPDQKLKETSNTDKFLEFVEHMRYQETNEVTAVRDKWYVDDTTRTTDDQRAAFGRLMLAWDASSNTLEGGAFTKTGDYLAAILSSPSTWLGAIAGRAVGKIVTKGATKSTQLSVRASVQNANANAVLNAAGKTKPLTKAQLAKLDLQRASARGINPSLNIWKEAGKGALIGGGIEGGTAVVHQKALVDVREETIDGYEMDPMKYWTAVTLQGVFGAGVGGFARGVSASQKNKAIADMTKFRESRAAAEAKALKKANVILKTTDPAERKKILDNLEVISLMSRDKSIRPPLNKEAVKEGDLQWDDLMNLDGSDFRGGFSIDTLRRIAGAQVELERIILKGDPSKRITENLALAISDPNFNVKVIDKVLNKYNLNRDQLSLMLMSDMSAAGKTLAVASAVERRSRILATSAALAKKGVITLDDEILKKYEKMAMDNSGASVSNRWLDIARDIDSMRVGFMTSQPSTTAANIVSSVGRIGADISDRFVYNMINRQNPLSGVMDVIKGMSWNHAQAEVAAEMVAETAPSMARRLFHSAAQVDDAMGGNSRMNKLTRAVNILNTATDVAFKKGVFYASINRQLLDEGSSFAKFMETTGDIAKLPAGVLVKAKNDALRFTFQSSYVKGSSKFADGASTVIRLHRDIPFIVSSVVPFPRYIANQIEFIHDYTPGMPLITGGLGKLFKGVDEKGIPAPTQIFPKRDTGEAIANQVTGAMMFMSAFAFRASQGGKTEPLDYVDPNDNTTRSVERWGGPWNTHLVIADAIYRWHTDKSPPKPTQAALQILEAATGVGLTGYNANLISEVIKSMQTGDWTNKGTELLADVSATLTYPAAVLRDIQGQFSPDDSAPSPYLRIIDEVASGGNANFLDMWVKNSLFVNRALRMLPDIPQLQYLQTINGETDIPLFSGFGTEPVREWNPMLKQLTGQSTRPPNTDHQTALIEYGLKEFIVFPKRRFENPTVDYLVRRTLVEGEPSMGIKPMWQAWEDAGLRDSLDNLPREEGKSRLDAWTKGYITSVGQDMSEALDALRQKGSGSPMVAGYIRSLYNIEQSNYKYNAYDAAIADAKDIPFETAEEFIQSAYDIPNISDKEAIERELANRELVMILAKRFHARPR